jgi:cobaltochelatase CobN
MGRMKLAGGIILGCILLVVFASPSFAGEKCSITVLTGVSDFHKVGTAISEILGSPKMDGDFSLHCHTQEDVKTTGMDAKTREDITQADILLVDIMYRGLRHYVSENVDFRKTKVYSMRFSPMDKKGKQFMFDPEVLSYSASPTKANIKNLLLFLLKRDCGLNTEFKEPMTIPPSGIFHPDAPEVFSGFDEYLAWYQESGRYRKDGFWVGISEYSRYAAPGDVGKISSALVHLLEKAGINAVAVYSHPSYHAVKEFLFDEQGKSRVDILCGLSFKLGAVSDAAAHRCLSRLDVPLLNAIRSSRPVSEWRESPQGLSPFEISTRICKPEFNALIEPSVLGGLAPVKKRYSGKAGYTFQPIMENIRFFIERIKAWKNLQTKANKDKKIAIFYYNHSPGKQNVAASYLNVFRSLEEILSRLRREGYSINGSLPSENDIKTLVLRSGRNIGSWAPGELEELVATGKVIQLPVDEYLKWFDKLPDDYGEKVVSQWGNPGESEIMTRDQKMIIPCVQLGNIILLPQPTRGWGDDPMKLYHSPLVWPHHQYTAVYLWLKKKFHADAVIHLGRHGTHEWLPGKEAGLSPSCPPEVLIQDLPNIYPYIVDGIGEGLQAKRRGRGVIIDHLTPVFKKSGIHEEYRTLAGLIEDYHIALKRDKNVAQEKLKRARTLIRKLGIHKDLGLEEIDEEAMEEIEHYLLEIGQTMVPYGLHSFGKSPSGEALNAFAAAIHNKNDKIGLDAIKKNVARCGPMEMDRLIHALAGRYVPAGQGNDPIRSPEAIPTGKNFYGFDPKKIPSREAFILGEKTANQMIEKYRTEKGHYPNKIGMILWACETVRNEGINEAAILHLMGMKPVWDKNDRVVGVTPIPGAVLERPRIDVHIQSSGLYRDSFPNVILLLDEAVQQAVSLKDVENFIAEHSRKIEDALLKKGYDQHDAQRLSKLRVFSSKPGSYGTKIAELIPNSGTWENEEEIVDVFIHQVSYAYGKGIWGKPLKSAYRKNLEDVNITMHSRSSNLYMTMDNDDVFQYLGGLSLAVKSVSGAYPDVLVSQQADMDHIYTEDVEKTIGKELRSRYLNPEWIQGMKKENYAGAREMADFVENMWGWQTTTPFAVDGAKWEQVYEVYMEDKYGLDLKRSLTNTTPGHSSPWRPACWKRTARITGRRPRR